MVSRPDLPQGLLADGSESSDVSLLLNGAVSGALPNVNLTNGFSTNGLSYDDQAMNGPTSVNMSEIEGCTEFRNKNEHQQADSSCNNQQLPIAICGMALRLPSGLKNPQQLWEFLMAKRDARSRIPENRYNVSGFFDKFGRSDAIRSEYGYFLEEDLGMLDTSFFNMSRTELERTDPQQRLLLEVVRECLEDACEISWRGKNIGCYMGSFGEDWCEIAAKDTQNWGNYRVTGVGDFSLSNRVSYEMDLRGPRSAPMKQKIISSDHF